MPPWIIHNEKGPGPALYTKPDTPIPVTVRVMWEDGTEEFVDCLAIGWTEIIVRVFVDRPPRRQYAVWFHHSDVRRR